MAEYALSDLEVTALERNELTAFFEATAQAGGNRRAAFNWVSGEVARKINELGERFDRQRMTPSALACLIALVEKGTISASIAKSVFDTDVRERPGGQRTSSKPTVWRRSATKRRCSRACEPSSRPTQTRSRRFAVAKPGRSAFSSGR